MVVFTAVLCFQQHGHAERSPLQVTLDHATVCINLSKVYDPFPELLAWGREICEGDLPVEIEIDKEGRETALTMLRTDDPQRVLLRVRRKIENTVLLEGVVSRAALAETLKTELIRFFTTEFDPHHWDVNIHEELDDDEIQVKDAVLSHAWLASNSR